MPYYDNQYKGFLSSNGTVATNVAIQHPNIYYFVLDASWSSTNSLEFWSYKNSVTTVNNNKIYKTIYSPSPTGYVEPQTGSFTGFTTTGGNSLTTSQFNISGGFSKGFNFFCNLNFTGATISFSALGFREAISARETISTGGILIGIGLGGNYWSSGPSSTGVNARSFDFNPTLVSPQTDICRDYGFSLRSISE